MKAASVELVPRAALSVVLGVVVWMSVRSIEPVLASLSPEKAVTAIGTVSNVSSRRRAVTTISWPDALAAASAAWVAGAGAASWAKAGVASAIRLAPAAKAC